MGGEEESRKIATAMWLGDSWRVFLSRVEGEFFCAYLHTTEGNSKEGNIAEGNTESRP